MKSSNLTLSTRTHPEDVIAAHELRDELDSFCSVLAGETRARDHELLGSLAKAVDKFRESANVLPPGEWWADVRGDRREISLSLRDYLKFASSTEAQTVGGEAVAISVFELPAGRAQLRRFGTELSRMLEKYAERRIAAIRVLQEQTKKVRETLEAATSVPLLGPAIELFDALMAAALAGQRTHNSIALCEALVGSLLESETTARHLPHRLVPVDFIVAMRERAEARAKRAA